MAKSEETRRRFAPVHVETTFERVRVPKRVPQRAGPDPELTPEPSPRSPSPILLHLPHREKRRFAPQLIETSRRARRVGDVGPATRPTDKTDITPYTNHIYLNRSRSRRRLGGDGQDDERQVEDMVPTRRESEDEEFSGYLLELAAREAERQIREVALAAFPNSRAREGGVAHFYFRESEEDEAVSEATSPGDLGVKHYGHHHPRVLRRKSSDLGYWHKAMQEHAELVAKDKDVRDQLTTREVVEGQQDESELGDMDEAPPEPLWLTTKRRTTKLSSKGSLPGPHGPIGEFQMPLIESDPYITSQHPTTASSPAILPLTKPIGENFMPYIPSAPAGRAADMGYNPASRLPAETGFRSNAGGGGFGGRPFGAFGNFGLRDEEDGELRKLRNAASPPMLGKDLRFRKCPSPQLTKLEPDHPFLNGMMAEDNNRDPTEQGGLWRGYCYRAGSEEPAIAPPHLHGPRYIATPQPVGTPSFDPFAAAFGGSFSDESSLPPISHPASTSRNGHDQHLWSGGVKGLHMLHGLDERLQREKQAAEEGVKERVTAEQRDRKIAAEFDDGFVTQVYNYLSLGYPATARAFDEELSKISRIPISELTGNDEKQLANGHLFDIKIEGTSEDERCPRWRALKIYILEWARQHPDLDSLDPLAWGVRERRGSWAI